MKNIYVLMIICVLWLSGCSNHSEMTTSTGLEVYAKTQLFDNKDVADVDSLTKCKMYRESMKSFISTSPNYVVVVVKNKNSGIVKEICTESTRLWGAIDKEEESKNVRTVNERSKSKMLNGSGFDKKSYPNRYFEFGDKEALSSIDFDLYTKSELENYSRTMNVSGIIKDVKSGKVNNKTFTGERKEQIMFAHIMFNKGVMVARGCIAGNVCSLEYFEPKTSSNSEIFGVYGLIEYFEDIDGKSDYYNTFLLNITKNEVVLYGTINTKGSHYDFHFSNNHDTLVLKNNYKIFMKDSFNSLILETKQSGVVKRHEYKKYKNMERLINDKGLILKELSSFLSGSLIAGKYSFENKTVNFKKNGEVVNLKNFNTYKIKPRIGTCWWYDNRIIETDNGIWKYRITGNELRLTKYSEQRDENDVFILGNEELVFTRNE